MATRPEISRFKSKMDDRVFVCLSWCADRTDYLTCAKSCISKHNESLRFGKVRIPSLLSECLFLFCILQYFGWVRHDKQDKYVREFQAMSAATVERWTKAFISLSLLLVLMALISAYIAGRLVTTSKMGF